MRTRIVFLLMVASTWQAVPVSAQFACWDVRGRGPISTVPDAETGYNVGDIPVWIGDKAYTIYSQSTNLGMLGADAETGALEFRLSHLWRIEENGQKLVTFDDATFTPTENPAVFTAVIRFQVMRGGRYNCGEAIVAGQVDFSTGEFSSETEAFYGRFCHCD